MSVSKEYTELRVRLVYRDGYDDETLRHGLEALMCVCEFQWDTEYLNVDEDDVARWKAEDEEIPVEDDEEVES